MMLCEAAGSRETGQETLAVVQVKYNSGNGRWRDMKKIWGVESVRLADTDSEEEKGIMDDSQASRQRQLGG